MDIDRDGHPDLLSGSYSRQGNAWERLMGGGMAGLFQVLPGRKDGTFGKPRPLNGSNGLPLIIHTQKKLGFARKVCTRPFAADLDADGDLDLIVGNLAGSFFFFEGKGPGVFAPEARLIRTKEGEILGVRGHSDPFLIDWDGDGDLDLFSGSLEGGVFLALNEGTAKKPSFGLLKPIVPPVGTPKESDRIVFGEAHLDGPRTSTRVWVADVDRDGKLDLLVGDQYSTYRPADGLEPADALARYTEHQKLLIGRTEDFDMDAWQETAFGLVRRRMSGTVWLLRGK